MKQKPVIFNLFAIFFLIGILIFPLQVMMLYDHQLSEISMVLAKLTFSNWLVISIFLINSVLCFTSHTALKSTIPASILIVAANNWIVSTYGQDFTSGKTLLSTAIFSLTVSTLYFTKALDVLLNPQLKWWTVPLRYQKKLPIWIKVSDHQFYLENTFDISKSGVFVSEGKEKIGYSADSSYSKDMAPGDLVKVSIPSKTGKYDFKCEAKVVRKAKEHGLYPGGVGLQFVNLHLKDKINLRRILHQEKFGFSF